MTSVEAMNTVRELGRKYDITGKYEENLIRLVGFKMALILDDSTSMNEKLRNGMTKWCELKKSCEVVLDIANSLRVQCDVFFLNRFGKRNVQNISELQQQFNTVPYGNTPLTKTFHMAIDQNQHELHERKLLIIVFTDGSPTWLNHSHTDAVKDFKYALKNRTPIDRIFVSIVACTDDKHAIKYLNRWDRSIINMDVVDDFDSERQEIYSNKRNCSEGFTYGDYIAKILLGSFVREIDLRDERCKCVIL